MIEKHTPNPSNIPNGCKFCGSRQLVRYGRYNSIQRWFCKECNRKFVDNHAPPGLRTPAVQIASALSMFYEGMSLNTIRRHLDQAFHNLPSDSTVYEWIIRYTKAAVSADEARRAHTKKITQELGHGPFWIANDTAMNIETNNVWIWDIVDYGSRILVTSLITTTQTSQDVKTTPTEKPKLEEVQEKKIEGEQKRVDALDRLKEEGESSDLGEAYKNLKEKVEAERETTEPQVLQEQLELFTFFTNFVFVFL